MKSRIRIYILGAQLGLLTAFVLANEFAEDRIIVKFKPGCEDIAVSLAKSEGGGDAEKVSEGTFLIPISGTRTVEDMISALEGAEEVAYVEPDYKRAPNGRNGRNFSRPLNTEYQIIQSDIDVLDKPTEEIDKKVSDLKIGDLESSIDSNALTDTKTEDSVSNNEIGTKMIFRRKVKEKDWGLKKVNYEAAWKISKGNKDVTIAVLDTGIDDTHKDLSSKLINCFNATGESDQYQDDDNHGTHCAGMVGAKKASSEGVNGLARKCKIMSIKVLKDGIGYASWVSAGIRKAVEMGANVISMSIGSGQKSKTEEEAIKYAIDHGVVLIAAAGNEGDPKPDYPAKYPDVLAVASSNADDTKSDFSNYGKKVHVAAPGKDIYSTVPNGYAYMSGTSMATPIVAGLAGLIISVHPKATVQDVHRIIQSTADKVGDWVIHGRINAGKALELAQSEALSK